MSDVARQFRVSRMVKFFRKERSLYHHDWADYMARRIARDVARMTGVRSDSEIAPVVDVRRDCVGALEVWT